MSRTIELNSETLESDAMSNMQEHRSHHYTARLKPNGRWEPVVFSPKGQRVHVGVSYPTEAQAMEACREEIDRRFGIESPSAGNYFDRRHAEENRGAMMADNDHDGMA